VARSWRLRHKLILGLALVVVSIGLLLGGAMLGLSSYLKTMDTTDRKLDEMQCVTQLRDHIHKIGEATPADINSQKANILSRLTDAEHTLAAYRATLNEQTLRQNLDPDRGEYELAQILDLQRGIANLRKAVVSATPTADISQQTPPPLIQQKDVQEAYQGLTRMARDLFLHLISDVKTSFEGSKANHRRSLTIIGGATAIAFVLVLTLLYYFRQWVFAPIKSLQAGVQRVHRGDFDNPIKLTSHDELEELAVEFNAMTVRLRDVYRDLAQQVNERTRQLVRSERMVSVGFLAAGVAHEINNPLASIAFCSEALERRLQELMTRAPGETEVIAKYLKMIQQEAFRCKQITQKLLDFSRTGGRREPVELSALIADVLEVAQHLPNARGKRLVFQPETTVVAPVSGPDVKSVVLNLVVNGLDSMEEGGTLTASLTTRGEFAELAFTDTGCGMTADVLENIFEPFFTRNRTGNGTGLGLSISHQIVDQHGGGIYATSAGPGKGSTFLVRLPLREIAPVEAPKARPLTNVDVDILAFPSARAA
jgi:two-component system, NtrC family, sensor kinase